MTLESDKKRRELRWVASATLGCVMAGHVMLETGVDALFLANVSIERLPLVTIAIAFLALAVSRLDGGMSHRRVLCALQVISAVGTIALWYLVGLGVGWVYYVLYVWSGIVTSLAVVRFWILLGDLFTISEGKGAFASIAMGGAIGALLGSGVSAAVAPHVGGEGLLLLASSAFFISALGPMLSLSPQVDSEGRQTEMPAIKSGWIESLRSVLDSPYAYRVALIVIVGGITFTMGDFLFKSVLAAEVSSEDLATWLSRVYLGLNLASIVVLAFGTTPVVRWLGVDRSLAVLPALIGVAALGVIAGGALGATIFLKLADGSLRYSLYKTASELLYLPMSSSLRLSVKTSIDLVGQSGAKAFASVLVLGLVLLPESRMVIAGAVVLSSVLWIGLALRLRRSYLDVFRNTLSEGMIETVLEHPELDLESAGSLLRALSDPDERRALAAMRLLSERGQLDLVPSLILYHPSPKVVVQALDLFAASGRRDVQHQLDHLIGHEDARVRSATVRAKWAIERDVDDLSTYKHSECLVVRVSAYSGLMIAGELSPDQFEGVLEEAIRYELPDARLAASTSARLAYHPIYREALARMAKDEDADVANEALHAICESGDEWFISKLVDLLGHRTIREAVRRALIRSGRPALDELSARLGCVETGKTIQAHIPRTIARFDDPDAVRHLLEGLSRVESGLVRFKLLRGLETLLLSHHGSGVLHDSHHSGVDLSPLRVEFERTLSRTLGNLQVERRIMRAQSNHRAYATVAGGLLVDLLRDKRVLAVGRLFMMLGLLHPKEDFRTIQSGLRSEDATDRASAQELIETLLSGAIAAGLLDLVVGEPAGFARANSGELSSEKSEDYAALLGVLLTDGSETLRAVALYHAGELGYDSLESSSSDSGPSVLDRARSAGRSGKELGLAAVRDLLERSTAVKSRLAS